VVASIYASAGKGIASFTLKQVQLTRHNFTTKHLRLTCELSLIDQSESFLAATSLMAKMPTSSRPLHEFCQQPIFTSLSSNFSDPSPLSAVHQLATCHLPLATCHTRFAASLCKNLIKTKLNSTKPHYANA